MTNPKHRQRRALLATLLFSGGIGFAHATQQPHASSSISMHFELTNLTGNLFDFLENDIQVEVVGPRKQTLSIPAFFDGGNTWGMRCTPPAPGQWAVGQILRNGKPIEAQNISAKTFIVSPTSKSGFIRRDPKHAGYFAYETGEPYYPIGCNAAWSGGGVTVEEFLTMMQTSGQNWSRIWMCHWDGKNLDWNADEKLPEGHLSLTVAKRWDSIVATAERCHIPFQMVLQHHGQYSSQVNPNWPDNPWNAKNGGMLEKPEEFFTNEKARQLTRAKYRYILARWGYSPQILAWELFNEVQFTDAARAKQYAEVTAWHQEMATFLRKHDVHHHMVTTSSDENIPGLYTGMDYRQPHSYPPDLVATIREVGTQFYTGKTGANDPKQPVFLGEIGTGAVDLSQDDGTYLHQILWSGIMTTAPGAAQYWTWDNIARRKLAGAWKPATDFVRVFRLAERRSMQPVSLVFTEANRGAGATSFGPGGGWGATKQTNYIVEASGDVAGAGAMSPYLQGDNNRTLFPYAEFAVKFETPGTFAIHIRQVSKNGANVVMKVDGKTGAEKSFPATTEESPMTVTMSVPVPAGSHTIRLENTGTDWARIEKITLSPYGAVAHAVAKADKESVAAWIYPSDAATDAPPLTMTVSIPGLNKGKYKVYWWDTKKGSVIDTETVAVAEGKALTLKTPPIYQDIALFVALEHKGNVQL